MHSLGMPNIEVGFAQASGDDAFQTGVDVASVALEGIKWHQVSAGLVFASSSHDLSELMKGIRSVVDEAPVFGSATNDESHEGEVTLILLASPFLEVKISTGRD
ncbi:MAG: hypothetical protein KAQ65_02820, partial [Candidatus Thorarchaeota archaeon]|nr:hypothetical protein [Candidatus Thorarchaeota archaeon]